jgi:mannosyltransferase OCH1-like enzyme
MIPKKIHYCWFGKGKMPSRELKCIASWKNYMPEYELILWNESNFNIDSNSFTKEAYQKKKYAFVSDYVRLYVLINEGGIYLDTDVELLKSLDFFSKYDAFGSFETPFVIQTGVIGSISNGVLVKRMFEYYRNRKFILTDGSLNQIPNSKILTDILLEEGLTLNNKQQSLPSFELFPTDYFCPINQATQEIIITKDTYCIHYLSGSWLSADDRFKRTCKAVIGKSFGFKAVATIRGVFIKK